MNHAASDSSAARAVLREHWGYEAFRPGQTEAVQAALAGRDALAVLPTGGGKSVCYQVPALVLGGLTLVVSPLVALMADQVAQLKARGVAAEAVHSGLPHRDAESAWAGAEHGKIRLLYLSPERLQSEVFAARGPRLPARLLAVDEAHCVSEWGHDFRPAYRQIAAARPLLRTPEGQPVPCLALTATATPEVRRDIVEQLALGTVGGEAEVIVRGFDRPNLVWSVFHEEDPKAKMLEVLRGVPGSAAVYAGTRAGSEESAGFLQRHGISAEAYHAGMRGDARKAVQDRWTGGATRVVCATSAFGMGIDKPDVRAVVHLGPPASLEGYYQEAGRAGRDGKTAFPVLVMGPADAARHAARVADRHPDAAAVQRVYRRVLELAQVPLGSEPDGPVPVDAEIVGRLAELSPPQVRAAVEALERAGVWSVLADRPHHALLRFTAELESVRGFARGTENEALGRFVTALLRAVPPEAFSGWMEVDLRALEKATGTDRARLLRGLRFLKERELLALDAPGDGGARPPLRVVPAGPRTEQAALDHAALAASGRRAERRLADVLAYARSLGCRRRHLLAYFGERAPTHCGRCDWCRGRHRPPLVTAADEPDLRALLAALADGQPRHAWPVPTPRADALAAHLLGEGLATLADPLGETLELTDRGRAMRVRLAL